MAPSHEAFRRLVVRDWRQFDTVDLQFHPTLTVLTGANASGKTTLLSVLARHFEWHFPLLGVPARGRGPLRWLVDARRRRKAEPSGMKEIGRLFYVSGQAGVLRAPESAQSYAVTPEPMHAVPGLFIPSHRTLSTYQPLPNIPLQFAEPGTLFSQFSGELRNRWQGTSSGRTPLSYMKEALVSAAIFGEGNASVEPNPDAMAVWKGFQEILRGVMPESIGFRRLVVRLPDLLMHTKNGDFLLESMSGGINAIVELAWQIFLRSREHDSFTVCIDEPENHLHPSLQRAILPGLLKAFPRISFIVASHSPFIVTSVPDSNVFVLDVGPEGVVSTLLDMANKAASADETLRRVLGMETTVPLWVEMRVAELLRDFPLADPSSDDLRRIRESLLSIGLGAEFPAAIEAIRER